MIQHYKDLKVYQKAYEYSLIIHRKTLGFPKHEQYELSNQLRRATKSIAVNIAEGFGKRESVAEFKRFVKIAIGSADEVRVWLDYSKDLGYISMCEYDEYVNVYGEIAKMLTSIVKNWK